MSSSRSSTSLGLPSRSGTSQCPSVAERTDDTNQTSILNDDDNNHNGDSVGNEDDKNDDGDDDDDDDDDDKDPSLELSLEYFQTVFFGTEQGSFEDLVALAASSHSEFAARVVEESCDVVAESVRILNRLSQLYQEHNHVPAALRIEFVDHSHAALVHHPRTSTTMRPRVIAVPASIAESWKRSPSSSIAWHHVAATIHIHTEMEEDHPFEECNECIGVLHQARPDLSGCFSMTMSRWTFRLVWGDPGTIHASEALEWSDPASLTFALGFLHRLYRPFLADSTMQLEMPGNCTINKQAVDDRVDLHARPPVWLVQDDEGGTYRASTTIAVGKPWTCMNRVMAATQYRRPGEASFSDCPRTVIKDSWRRRGEETFCEDAILQHIHANGDVPGVCTLVSAFIVNDAKTLSLPEFHIDGLRKHRLILDGTGAELYSCESVVEFLMVMYDTLEVLKRVHERHGILHRDISIRNILRSSTASRSAVDGVKFSGDILGHKYPHLRSGPSCTLIDFDIAYWAGKTPAPSLKEPVGTPTFAARAIARWFRKISWSRPFPLEPLTGNALECYIHAFGAEHYDHISALHNNRTRLDEDSVREERAIFSPRHDAESCFWVILHFLMTALPDGADPTEGDLYTAQARCTRIETTEVGGMIDMRDSVLNLEPTDWSETLHPSLQRYGRLIYLLADVVQPIYEYFDPPLDDYHLHHAMQRILLQEICAALDAGDNVALDIHQRRYIRSPFIRRPSTPQDSKKRRRRDSLEFGHIRFVVRRQRLF